MIKIQRPKGRALNGPQTTNNITAMARGSAERLPQFEGGTVYTGQGLDKQISVEKLEQNLDGHFLVEIEISKTKKTGSWRRQIMSFEPRNMAMTHNSY